MQPSSFSLAWARLQLVRPSSLGSRPQVPGVKDQPSVVPLCWELLTTGSSRAGTAAPLPSCIVRPGAELGPGG